jgi:hypothetical protein
MQGKTLFGVFLAAGRGLSCWYLCSAEAQPAAQKRPEPTMPHCMRAFSALPQGCCRWLSLWLGLGVLGISLAGCGYTLVGAAPGTASRRMALVVLPFTNQTREPGVEIQVSAALRQAVLQSPVFALAAVADADTLRLQGSVRRFRAFAVSYDRNDLALQYRLEADILMRLTTATSAVPILEREMTAWAEYLVSTSQTVGEGTIRENVVAREVALSQLAQRFADMCTALLKVALL